MKFSIIYDSQRIRYGATSLRSILVLYFLFNFINLRQILIYLFSTIRLIFGLKNKYNKNFQNQIEILKENITNDEFLRNAKDILFMFSAPGNDQRICFIFFSEKYNKWLFRKKSVKRLGEKYIENEINALNIVKKYNFQFSTPNSLYNENNFVGTETFFGISNSFFIKTKHVKNIVENIYEKSSFINKFSQNKFLSKACLYWLENHKLSKNLNSLSNFLYLNNFDYEIHTSACHGDFTLWNIKYIPFKKYPRNLLIYDWEMFSENMSAGFDFIHYFCQLMLLSKNYSNYEFERTLFLVKLNWDKLKFSNKLDFDFYMAFYILQQSYKYKYYFQIKDKLFWQANKQLNFWEYSSRKCLLNLINK